MQISDFRYTSIIDEDLFNNIDVDLFDNMSIQLECKAPAPVTSASTAERRAKVFHQLPHYQGDGEYPGHLP